MSSFITPVVNIRTKTSELLLKTCLRVANQHVLDFVEAPNRSYVYKRAAGRKVLNGGRETRVTPATLRMKNITVGLRSLYVPAYFGSTAPVQHYVPVPRRLVERFGERSARTKSVISPIPIRLRAVD
jgi:hypothetical protein